MLGAYGHAPKTSPSPARCESGFVLPKRKHQRLRSPDRTEESDAPGLHQFLDCMPPFSPRIFTALLCTCATAICRYYLISSSLISISSAIMKTSILWSVSSGSLVDLPDLVFVPLWKRFRSTPLRSSLHQSFRNNRPVPSGLLVLGVASPRARVQLAPVADSENTSPSSVLSGWSVLGVASPQARLPLDQDRGSAKHLPSSVLFGSSAVETFAGGCRCKACPPHSRKRMASMSTVQLQSSPGCSHKAHRNHSSPRAT